MHIIYLINMFKCRVFIIANKHQLSLHSDASAKTKLLNHRYFDLLALVEVVKRKFYQSSRSTHPLKIIYLQHIMSIVLVLVFAPLINSQVPFLGPCPEYQTASDFDLNKVFYYFIF